MAELVFVYGTLQPGGQLHFRVKPYLAGPPLEATVRGRLIPASPDFAYPGLVLDGDDEVPGTVLSVYPCALEVLDAVEQEGWLYRRVRSVAQLDDGEEVGVWTYVRIYGMMGRSASQERSTECAES